MDIQPIIAFLKKTYPSPEVDPAWVRECVTVLIDAGQKGSIEDVHTQFLYSDLSQSTLPSRTFPQQDELHNIILFPRGSILQLHSISEIGYSAFQIQTTMEQRSEVLSGQSLIRRMDDEELPEVEEGKVPPYPRSMLKLELSDGRRIIKAIEYKRINGLVLGQTSLGCKLLCRNVRCLRDTLLLTPENTQVIESSVEHLESLQKEQFLNDLKRRMGKLVPENGNNAVNAPRVTLRHTQLPPPVRPEPTTTATASSSRPVKQSQIRLPSPGIIPTAGPSRSRYLPPAPAPLPGGIPLFDPPSSPHHLMKPKAIRANGVTPASTRKRSITSIDDVESPTSKAVAARTPRAAARAATAKVQQLYHDIPNGKLPEMDDGIDLEEEDEFDYDIDESFIRQIDEVEARAGTSNNQTSRISQIAKNTTQSSNDVYDFDEDDDDDDDFMILDESMIRQIDNLTNSHQTNKKGKGKQPENITNKSKKRHHDPHDEGDIIIDDKDEDEFHVDESFLRHLDEMEADRQEQQRKSSQSGYASSQLGISRKKASKSRNINSASGSSRSRGRRKSPSDSLEDSQKENKVPEIIEISD